MSAEKHSDASTKWLVFFFVCFAFVLLGIVIFFARPFDSQQSQPAPSGGHGGMILPQDGEYAPHAQRLPVA
jgi:hypothetical protein